MTDHLSEKHYSTISSCMKTTDINQFHFMLCCNSVKYNLSLNLPEIFLSVLLHCWLGYRKGIWPVKNLWPATPTDFFGKSIVTQTKLEWSPKNRPKVAVAVCQRHIPNIPVRYFTARDKMLSGAVRIRMVTICGSIRHICGSVITVVLWLGLGPG